MGFSPTAAPSGLCGPLAGGVLKTAERASTAKPRFLRRGFEFDKVRLPDRGCRAGGCQGRAGRFANKALCDPFTRNRPGSLTMTAPNVTEVVLQQGKALVCAIEALGTIEPSG